MLKTYKKLVKKTDDFYEYLDGISRLSKNLYNASLFRIRNNFTARNKEADKLTDFEKQIKKEVENTVLKKGSIGAVINYEKLDKLMRQNNNPDYFAKGLPNQTAQHIEKMACADFKAWLAALRAYKLSPSGFTGRPKMPQYCRSDVKTFKFTNQDAILISEYNKLFLKLPYIKERLHFGKLDIGNGRLKEVNVKPFFGNYLVSLVVEQAVSTKSDEQFNLAGLDIGVDNIAAVAVSNGNSLICKGGIIKAENQWWNKETARLKSILTKQMKTTAVTSKRLANLNMHRYFFMTDKMHKISTCIRDFLVRNNVGILVIGENKYWKQKSRMRHENKQTFVQIPFEILKRDLEYKCLEAGIQVIYQEESYTSKADFLCKDFIPVYDGKKHDYKFSGLRKKRGLYYSGKGTIVNADLNGAANILRKAYPDAFSKVKNFGFLNNPLLFQAV